MGDLLTAVLLPLVVVAIMIIMGLALETDDFRELARRPRSIVAGLVSQLVLLPILGFAVALSFPLEPVFAAGVVLIASCPGGSFANLLIHLADGDRALSVSLTTFGAVITMVSIPVLVGVGLRLFDQGDTDVTLPLGEALLQVAGLAVVPVLAGMWVRHRRPGLAETILTRSQLPATLALALVIIAIIVQEWDRIVDHGLEIGPAVLVLNVAALAVGYWFPALVGLRFAERVAISIGTGIQNVPLALAIALSVIDNDDLAIPAGIFGISQLLTAGAFTFAVRRSRRPTGTAVAADTG